jgi:perosamine synthetase
VRALDLPEGGTVITTPYSFVASANILLYEGLTPQFVDIDPATYNIDPARIEAAITPDTCAILAVDVFGRPAPWPRLREIADAHNLALIADSCEALGASIGDTPIGAWGDAAGFGFYPNKQITTGEGGCITTNDAALAETCRSLRNQGRATRGQMRHVRLGYNYRLSELNAALGAAQLDRLDAILKARARASTNYHEALASLSEMLRRPSQALANAKRSWFVYVIELRPPWTRTHRDALCAALQADGIGCAPYFPAIHLQPLYRERFGFREGAFPHCESVAARTLALPFFADITETQIRRVGDALHMHLPACAPESNRMPLSTS